ncbi:uncharacterized protein LOC126982974 [Eriocheir sinensis]|uniref:uncharacterized protein LOC126982974 n=1 Tax=Eriocheir sinensis TaxID=95602 RepID=UPI0021C940C6|nr:uncharacterized protein LOC126982974 [Eriocheir sinensis]
MGDFNAHHTHWEPSLFAAQQNRSGHSLVDFLAGSASFSLLTPPDLPTRIDPATARASTLDLCLGSGPLHLITVTTGPHIGSDHLPVILTFPSLHPPPQAPGRPRWSLRADNWHSFLEHLSSSPLPPNPSSDTAIEALADTLVVAGSHCFTFRSSQPPRLLRAPWWNRQCEAAVRAKRGAFNAWRRRPIPELRRRFHQLEARCQP